MTRVSVVIPTFNRTGVLRAALDSVLAQTGTDFEVIVVDDASTEDVESAVTGFDDLRLRYLRHDLNRGAPAARNTGLAAAQGAFVAFLDSDDLWLPDKLVRQLALFEDGPPDLGLVYGGYRFEDGSSRTVMPRERGDLSQVLLLGNCVGGTSLPLIRRSCLEAVGGFDESLRSCQDWDLWIRLAGVCRFDFVDQVLVVNRLQAEGITRSRDASIDGHRRLAAKHARAIRALPRSMRARHHLYMGRIFFWKRALGEAFGYLGRAVWLDPSLLPAVADFVALRPLRKRLLRGPR